MSTHALELDVGDAELVNTLERIAVDLELLRRGLIAAAAVIAVVVIVTNLAVVLAT